MAGQSTDMMYSIGIFDDEDTDRNPAALRRLGRCDRRRGILSRVIPMK